MLNKSISKFEELKKTLFALISLCNTSLEDNWSKISSTSYNTCFHQHVYSSYLEVYVIFKLTLCKEGIFLASNLYNGF